MKNIILIVLSLVLFSCGKKEETVKASKQVEKIVKEYTTVFYKLSETTGKYSIEEIDVKNITKKDSLYFESQKIITSSKNCINGINFLEDIKNVETKMIAVLIKKGLITDNYVIDWNNDFSKNKNKLNVDDGLDAIGQADKISDLSLKADDKIILYQKVRATLNLIKEGEEKKIYLFFNISKDFKIMDSPLKLSEYIFYINKSLEQEEWEF